MVIEPPVKRYDLAEPKEICAVSGKALAAGEAVYSVLFDREGKWQRQEVAVEAWPGPPDGAVSYWRTRITTAKPTGPVKTDPQRLWDCFIGIVETNLEPRQEQLRYLLALWLVRCRRLKLVRREAVEGGSRLLVQASQVKRTFEVNEPTISPEECERLEQELAELLA